MTMQWQSNAQWEPEVYSGEYGNGISTDAHLTEGEARAVCAGLERDGFGGQRKDYPIKTWVSQIAARESK